MIKKKSLNGALVRATLLAMVMALVAVSCGSGEDSAGPRTRNVGIDLSDCVEGEDGNWRHIPGGDDAAPAVGVVDTTGAGDDNDDDDGDGPDASSEVTDDDDNDDDDGDGPDASSEVTDGDGDEDPPLKIIKLKAAPEKGDDDDNDDDAPRFNIVVDTEEMPEEATVFIGVADVEKAQTEVDEATADLDESSQYVFALEQDNAPPVEIEEAGKKLAADSQALAEKEENYESIQDDLTAQEGKKSASSDAECQAAGDEDDADEERDGAENNILAGRVADLDELVGQMARDCEHAAGMAAEVDGEVVATQLGNNDAKMVGLPAGEGFPLEIDGLFEDRALHCETLGKIVVSLETAGDIGNLDDLTARLREIQEEQRRRAINDLARVQNAACNGAQTNTDMGQAPIDPNGRVCAFMEDVDFVATLTDFQEEARNPDFMECFGNLMDAKRNPGEDEGQGNPDRNEIECAPDYMADLENRFGAFGDGILETCFDTMDEDRDRGKDRTPADIAQSSHCLGAITSATFPIQTDVPISRLLDMIDKLQAAGVDTIDFKAECQEVWGDVEKENDDGTTYMRWEQIGEDVCQDLRDMFDQPDFNVADFNNFVLQASGQQPGFVSAEAENLSNRDCLERASDCWFSCSVGSDQMLNGSFGSDHNGARVGITSISTLESFDTSQISECPVYSVDEETQLYYFEISGTPVVPEQEGPESDPSAVPVSLSALPVDPTDSSQIALPAGLVMELEEPTVVVEEGADTVVILPSQVDEMCEAAGVEGNVQIRITDADGVGVWQEVDEGATSRLEMGPAAADIEIRLVPHNPDKPVIIETVGIERKATVSLLSAETLIADYLPAAESSSSNMWLIYLLIALVVALAIALIMRQRKATVA